MEDSYSDFISKHVILRPKEFERILYFWRLRKIIELLNPFALYRKQNLLTEFIYLFPHIGRFF